ncbi:MAG: hypothetical protein DMG36_23205 [Acidobacteria bacterium]|nr:MAG: hypothetical protein DMG36_23205 [Acidobacteriota bacterium]
MWPKSVRARAVKSYTLSAILAGQGTSMGNEALCKARFGKQESEGKALLETSEVRFRGDFQLKIPFSTIKSAKAVDGELRLQTAEGVAIFHLGGAAEKWLKKILHPKSRIEKLGVKARARVSLFGEFEGEFLREVHALTKSVAKGKAASDSEHMFLAADSKEDFSALPKIAKSMSGAAALWIVYPKGQKHITENDVLAAGRKCGLKDVKVVGFSATHTALKFVIPLASR